MSVVNKMLNDLENRSVPENGHTANYQAPDKVKGRGVVWGVLVFVVLGLAAVSTWLYISIDSSYITPTPLSAFENERPNETIFVEPVEADQSAVVKSESAALKQNGSDVEIRPSQENTSIVQTTIKKVEPTSPVLRSSKSQNEQPEIDTASTSDVKLAVVPSGGKRFSNYQTLVADALANNNSSKAKAVLAQWIDDEPLIVDARKKLAALYFADRQYPQAEALLIQTQTLFPKNISVRLMQARLYSQLNKPEQAWHVLQLDSLEPDFLLYRASLARALNNNEQASQDYGALVTQSPNDVRAWLGLGIVSESLNNTPLALKSFQRVIVLANDDPEIKTYALQRIELLNKRAKP
ncbi:tetratricopeptide repeat protein [Alteromonas sp. 5E99-2]|uniref:tetratricopeptide repeat protein n=1 Tax=Alteromonas sp. 5E99-2 TaxID=2817683 RepID=UPI001A99F171|nr:tetratricopeptide repeat protein [Alteromonas sp. 5E99-2]MBO1255847.1 tetratricopeptide repeat protein [Alteromonas sp. 5E99-2]